MDKAATQTCQICRKDKQSSQVLPAGLVQGPLLELIRTKYPDWDPQGCVCQEDLNRIRSEYIQHVLEIGKKEVESLEAVTAKDIEDSNLITKNMNEEFDRRITFGEKMADRIADFGGSWVFIGIFAFVLLIWILVNTLVLIIKPFDPYPFIFLNLILSCLAAIQAPVIMMSQNRQEAKDRFQAEQDFRTNLKAELEIRYIHDKLDYLLMHQWQRLLEIQEIQVELMEQLAGKDSAGQKERA